MEGEGFKKKRFDRDFKISAVKMVTQEGHTAAEVARSLGIHANQLYNWKKKYSDDGEKAFPGKGHLTEISALRKELREVQIGARHPKKKQSAYFQKRQRTVRVYR
jgi:transposase